MHMFFKIFHFLIIYLITNGLFASALSIVCYKYRNKTNSCVLTLYNLDKPDSGLGFSHRRFSPHIQ